MKTCITRGCDRSADIKVADLILCARHYKAHVDWPALQSGATS